MLSVILAIGVVTAANAQQAQPTTPSKPAAKHEQMRHSSSTGKKTVKRQRKGTVSPTSTAADPMVGGGANPAGTVPPGAPGTPDPTIPGSRPQP